MRYSVGYSAGGSGSLGVSFFGGFAGMQLSVASVSHCVVNLLVLKFFF